MKQFILFSFIICIAPQGLAIENPESAPAIYESPTFIPNEKLNLSIAPLTEGKIQIDGQIDEAWKASCRFENFTEYLPTENRKPVVETQGYLTHDSENLYAIFICKDPDLSKLRASFTDRDNIFEDDYVCVSIDPNLDQQMAYQFYANPRGIQGDKLWQANGEEDESFDIVFESEAAINGDHWCVEMKIPFSSMRFPATEVQNWAVHFTRYYPRDDEYIYSWMPVSKNNSSFMGQAGTLSFHLPKTNQEKRTFELLPYVITTQNSQRDVNPASTNFNTMQHETLDKRAGFGVKYGLTSNLTTDIAFNPDFSQIESDEGQMSINNPFAFFYQEKRPFFQEGSEIYNVDQNTPRIVLDQYVNLFYSRSINDPLVAGKLSGKIGKVSVGYTSAYDKNTPWVVPFEEHSVALPSSQNSYSNIIRGRYDLGNQSSVGLFFSNRSLETSGSNSVAALDARYRMNEKMVVSAIAAYTHTREPDNAELSSMLGSTTFKVGDKDRTAAFDGESYPGYLLRGKWQFDSRHVFSALAYQDFSPGFRADNGFVWVNAYRMAEVLSGYTFRFDNHKLFTFIEPRFNVWRKYNYDGLVKDTGLRPTITFRLKNQVTMQVSAFVYNRENLRGKQFGDARAIWGYIQSRMHNAVTGWVYYHVGEEINRFGVEGDPNNPFDIIPSRHVNAGLTLKPTAKITDDLEISTFDLWFDGRARKLRDQSIIRNALAYQFNKELYLRLIGEYNMINWINPATNQMDEERYFSFEPLLSYQMNAFSVFYLGAHFGTRTRYYLDWNELKLDDQSVYLKFQYLFRP